MEQGRDLYLSCTIVWITETALGSQNVFTSLVNPSTVVDLFFQPNTSLQASSYSNCKQRLWGTSVQVMLNLQCILHSCRFLHYPESLEDSWPHLEVSWCTFSMPLPCWWSLENCLHSIQPRTGLSSAHNQWICNLITGLIIPAGFFWMFVLFLDPSLANPDQDHSLKSEGFPHCCSCPNSPHWSCSSAWTAFWSPPPSDLSHGCCRDQSHRPGRPRVDSHRCRSDWSLQLSH